MFYGAHETKIAKAERTLDIGFFKPVLFSLLVAFLMLFLPLQLSTDALQFALLI